MEQIRCTLHNITYTNPENGYSVFQVEVDGIADKWQTVVGTFSDIRVGSTLLLHGEWRDNKKYGHQFVVQSWMEEMPSDVKGIENYLASGMIRGIGKQMAARIVKYFGERTIDILDKDPERLREVSGIGKDRVRKIKESWAKQKGVRDVMVFLQGHGVSSAYAVKIYKEYKEDSILRVKENPYCLADDIFGIGFKMADEIARNFGIVGNDNRRLRSGIIFTLNTLAKDGHCYAEREELVTSAKELLAADESLIDGALESMLFDRTLISDGSGVFLPKYYYSEFGVAKKLKSLLHANNEKTKVKLPKISDISEKTHIEYDDVQIAAIKEAVSSKVMVLTGGPGTGKTTTTLGIIDALESMELEILCAAPTGRAAKRMSEATGKEAKTIHRLLEYKPDAGFTFNEDNPLHGDVLIVDECSMIDIMLMHSLLKAVPDNMRLILVGDIDQLPSVGAGNVLSDIIDSGVVPVVRLTHIFRQALSSRIVTNAHKVNRGEFPDTTNGKESDFFFIEQTNPEQAAAEIVNIVKNRIPKAYGYSTNDIQVLVPMRKSAIGAIPLNVALQQAINPVGDFIESGVFKYRVGDRVMQIKNDYGKGVFNGDIGFVESLDMDERTLNVRFDDNLVEYESGDFSELTLAYACTIHKSQGSEYPVVVMPIMTVNYIMLQRNLVYTGITRAKKLCIVIGEKKALAMAVKNQTVLKRNTRLKERLHDV